MNPIGIALLLVGYGLVIPVATKMNRVVRSQNRLALTGHQFGILIVCLGWMVGGRVPLVWIHLLWAVVAVIWFNWFGTKQVSS
ncbi:MAG: hypothetical protein ACN4GZ_08450 [Acidimicrobiales bacterium]